MIFIIVVVCMFTFVVVFTLCQVAAGRQAFGSGGGGGGGGFGHHNHHHHSHHGGMMGGIIGSGACGGGGELCFVINSSVVGFQVLFC